ncbi:unnamed protein product [Ectocarpus sp. CCAP 1310/34]|nr:unnamed protein product [Ectocarpus sp. CCAP 1310/34]
MKHLRDWFVTQKQNYTNATKKKGTGLEGGRIQRSPNKFQQLRAHVFSGNAAANKRKFMRGVVNGKRPKVAPADAAGAAAPVAVEEDAEEEPPMETGGEGGDWPSSESEDEDELRSRGGARGEGGMTDGDLEDAADDSSPDVVEVTREGRRATLQGV